jgi:hypothetical protein
MSNRLITLGLFGLIMTIFGSYFIIQRINFPAGEPVKGYFQGIIQDAGRDQWEKAIRKSDQLQKIWRQKRFLVMLNYSEADYQFFEDALHRLAAAVRTGDRYHTISQAMVGLELWENFLKLVPEP